MTQAINPCFQIIRINKEKESPPAYYQLSKKIENLISEGFLKSGDELPSSRVLSAMLNLSRTTVTQAYKRLLEEGWIFSEKGRGCFVSECAIDLDLHKSSIATLSNNIKNPNYQLKLKLQNRLYSFQYKRKYLLLLLRLTWKASREKTGQQSWEEFQKAPGCTMPTQNRAAIGHLKKSLLIC